ncbi:L-rhamnose isomerase [Streptomyces tendae]
MTEDAARVPRNSGITHSDDSIRQKAIDHHFECIDVMHQTGSRDLQIWLANGTNYPGQDDMRARQDRLTDSLQQIYARLGDDQRLVLEYELLRTGEVGRWS